MTDVVLPPPTEQELLDGNVRIKKALRYSAILYTPIIVGLLWYLDVPMWWLIAGAFVIGEFVSYPLLVKMVDRNTEQQSALLRSQDAEPPQFPVDQSAGS